MTEAVYLSSGLWLVPLGKVTVPETQDLAACVKGDAEVFPPCTSLRQSTHICPVLKENIPVWSNINESSYRKLLFWSSRLILKSSCFTFFGLWAPARVRTAVCKYPAEVSRRWGFTVITAALGSELGSFLNCFLRDVNHLSWVLFVVLAEVSSVSKHKSEK